MLDDSSHELYTIFDLHQVVRYNELVKMKLSTVDPNYNEHKAPFITILLNRY